MDGPLINSTKDNTLVLLEATSNCWFVSRESNCVSVVRGCISFHFTKIFSTRVSTSKSRVCDRRMLSSFVLQNDANKPSRQFITDSAASPAVPARERSSNISLKRPHLYSLVCQNSVRRAMPCCKLKESIHIPKTASERALRDLNETEIVSRAMKRGVLATDELGI
jgi:hypothetical protein